MDTVEDVEVQFYLNNKVFYFRIPTDIVQLNLSPSLGMERITNNAYAFIENHLIALDLNVQGLEKLKTMGLTVSIHELGIEHIIPPQEVNISQTTNKIQIASPNTIEKPAVKSSNTLDIWSDEITKFMLDKYFEYLPHVGPMKKFSKKMHMWKTIADELKTDLDVTKTWSQVENRYKTVMRRKKEGKKNNNTTGSARAHIEFEQEISKISSIDDSIEPEVLCNAQIMQVKENVEIHNEKKMANKGKSLATTLWEIHEAKEEAKNRRLKEKLAFLKSLFDQQK